MRNRPGGWQHGPAAPERAGAAMAHRRGLLQGQVLRAVAVIAVLAGGLAGAMFMTVNVTRLRADIAVLENHRECLAARAAQLQARWTAATRPAVIRERARRELGLIVPSEPEFVLVVQAPPEPGVSGLWRRMLAGLGAGGNVPAAAAATAPAGTMVTLRPRPVVPTVGDGS